jgi:hypothetical protein
MRIPVEYDSIDRSFRSEKKNCFLVDVEYLNYIPEICD